MPNLLNQEIFQKKFPGHQIYYSKISKPVPLIKVLSHGNVTFVNPLTNLKLLVNLDFDLLVIKNIMLGLILKIIYI
ncbi:hypothetical protein CSA08_04605 [Candidatus Gracilibacteria bacterium]|nr:MAG: hypothetical protein CSA08_04605 [Candidatus Gracilibacteria bacterium]